MASPDPTKVVSQMNDCLQILHTLEKSYIDRSLFIAQLKGFIQCLFECLPGVSACASLAQNRPYKSKILLCVSQVTQVLGLFGSISSHPPVRETVWYLSERMRWCLSELQRVLGGSGTQQDEDCDGSESFTQRIDLALQLLHTHPPSWRLLIDDLIYQAITISRVAEPVDYKEITAACQQVLEESNQLTSGTPGDPNQLTLLTDSLSASLARLEHRVNTAVLRLLLQAFSDPSKVMKELVKCCKKAPSQRHASDLDPLIAQLDAHIERIVLVSQFAVSCCRDAKKVGKMRCCLASVESLDNYLVPAVTSLYLSPQSLDKRAFLRFLCEQWQQTVASLHNHLDAIIDSYAFTKVVQESMTELLDSVGAGDVLCSLTIVKQAWMLWKHLSSSCDISLPDGYIPHLKQAVYECDAAIYKQAPPAAVRKRVRLMAAAVDEICDQLSTAFSTLGSEKPCTGEGPEAVVNSIRDLPQDVSLRSVGMTRQYPYRPQCDSSNKINDAKNSEVNNLNLTNIISEGIKEISSANKNTSNVKTPEVERSGSQNNVFQTPRRSTVSDGVNVLTPYLSKTTERTTTLYVRTPRRMEADISPTPDETIGDENSLDSSVLDITDILENLTELADTLSSATSDDSMMENHETGCCLTGRSCASIRTESSPEFNIPNLSELSDTESSSSSDDSYLNLPIVEKSETACARYACPSDSLGFTLVSPRTKDVSDINTPQRLQDLKDVEDKIQMLKKS